MTKTYTIGQVSRLSGLSPRRIRFYADEGLLPPAARTESGYRIFVEADLMRLELISALRDAGAGLEMIRNVLAQRLSLRDVLAARLTEVDASIASQHRIAATLRHALKSPEPTNRDLHRVRHMIDLSHSERRRAVKNFYDRITEGVEVRPQWKLRMVELTTPELPDEPTTEQIEAWIEMSRLLDNPDFVEKARAHARDHAETERTTKLDVNLFMELQVALNRRAREAVEQGLDPDSEIGRSIADDNIAMLAKARGAEADPDALERIRRGFLEHRPNMKRYWDLLRILRGIDSDASAETVWVEEATKLRLASPA